MKLVLEIHRNAVPGGEPGASGQITQVNHSNHVDRVARFELTTNPDDTVLDLLMQAGVADDTLLFRHSCHHGSCGTCACIINGKERLACRTPVGELIREEPGKRPGTASVAGKHSEGSASSEDSGTPVISVAPLKGFPAIKDLVLDPSPLFGQIDPRWPVITGSLEEEPERLGQKFESCIECGACISACPVTEPFQGPAPLALLHRRLQDLGEEHSDEHTFLLLRGAERDGVPACQRHVECSRVCPQNVAPARRIQELRKLLRQDAP